MPSDLPGVTLAVVGGFSGGDHGLGHVIVASGGNARTSLAFAATALPPWARDHRLSDTA
ncbi:hypothetical protein OG226_45795 [Streptomyces sp. NBC_01261]|uniref:hypothetical protein n=1 Tax=Streptomyces sp. NBC_01261 TaxID=2903802 RepID=UPI002E32F42B|nr:hypothetical protein [Streptomyces sp. NBC_01261]